jgi:HEAT repeat protein
MKRSWLVAAIFLCCIVAGGVYVRQHIETLGDRRAIADRLRELGANVQKNPNDAQALDELKAVLNGKWSFARTYACTVLKNLGPKAEPLTVDLIGALNCGDMFVEREAARALGTVAVGDPRPVPALIRKLSEDDRDVAWFSAEALGNIGVPAIPAIPALENAAMSKWDSMAYHAKEALRKLKALHPN